ncbi:MAG: enoyl-CoA hydratase/isomerase family protein [Ilumatobacteraceae bacterium]
MSLQFGDVSVEVGDDHVALVEFHRPPNNFMDIGLLNSIADAYAMLDADDACRAIVLAAEGKHFCGGADFSAPNDPELMDDDEAPSLYQVGTKLFRNAKPVVAAVQGAAIGGGMGLACTADFRVGCPDVRMAAVFARLGFHHGFGLTASLPWLIGQQRALELLYTGRRIDGVEAASMGLLDRLVDRSEVRDVARAMAADIAVSAPAAVQSIRQTMRGPLAEAVPVVAAREGAEQTRLRRTEDFAEGVLAMSERRAPRFTGR